MGKGAIYRVEPAKPQYTVDYSCSDLDDEEIVAHKAMREQEAECVRIWNNRFRVPDKRSAFAAGGMF